MNILVIGNGFDLAHGLPTGYPDFLGFCRMVKAVYSMDKNDNADKIWESLGIKLKDDINTERLKLKFSELYSVSVTEKNEESGSFIRTNTFFDELYDDIEENIWIDYFLQNPMYQKENWIDFESEISKIIQSFDSNMRGESGKKYELTDIIEIYLSNDFLENYLVEHPHVAQYDDSDNNSDEITFKNVRNKLCKDLNRLIRALEIYLADYVEKIESKVKSKDIERIFFDTILSFNYTHTYEKIYDYQQFADYDYIHGQADLSNTIDTNNMVLGIDEYLPKDRKNKEIEFVEFKKFYQRIYKETGCEYKNWVDEIRSNGRIMNRIYAGLDEKGNKVIESVNASKHKLYIFGHSLDVTDADVLRDLLLNNNVHTTIYYLNKNVMGQQIANLVKVIGPDELIKRTGGSTKTIEFKQQAEMINTLEGENVCQ